MSAFNQVMQEKENAEGIWMDGKLEKNSCRYFVRYVTLKQEIQEKENVEGGLDGRGDKE